MTLIKAKNNSQASEFSQIAIANVKKLYKNFCLKKDLQENDTRTNELRNKADL